LSRSYIAFFKEQAMKWTIDPTHSQAEFSVRHMFTKVRGHMIVVSGTVEADDQDATRTVIVARLDPSTVNTGVSVRDDHLRSDDFFDVKQFPEIVFQSTAIHQTGPDQYAVSGTLSMHGIDRPVTLSARAAGDGIDPFGNRRAGVSARATVNRKDFGLQWNRTLESGGLLVGDEVDINLEIEAVLEQVAQDDAAA
jgi:polyisoprenoid-binding protein YceI